MLTIAVYDSNQTKLDELRNMIANDFFEYGIEYETIYFSDHNKLWNYLGEHNNIDVVLLNLCYQFQRGIQLVNDIEKTYPHIDLLFFSKQPGVGDFTSNTAAESENCNFETETKYILSRALSQNDLRMSLISIAKSLEQQEWKRITVRSKGQICSLRLSYIDYIVSSNRQIIFHGYGKELPVYGKLSEIEKKLGDNFLRCHQSYIVNIGRIVIFDKHGIQLSSGVRIPVSKARRATAYADFLRYTDGSSEA